MGSLHFTIVLLNLCFFTICSSSTISSRPIKQSNFAKHYRLMSADSNAGFSEEYKKFENVGRDQPYEAALLPCNKPKNRYNGILPYDHSRYKIKASIDEQEDCSNYINANYLPGYNSPKEFLVTQGPLHTTSNDFWRMVWESNGRAIVMLTRCLEKGKEKSDHYWPIDSYPVNYGDITVTILNKIYYPDWTISEFLLEKDGEKRTMKHFHFNIWPDLGLPLPIKKLTDFIKLFRDNVESIDKRPIIAHCSGGVGRTGTFITLDNVLQQLNDNNDEPIDIFGIVWSMRKERMEMVETVDQYAFVHESVVEALEKRNNNEN